jgi:hypothetical protein
VLRSRSVTVTATRVIGGNPAIAASRSLKLLVT